MEIQYKTTSTVIIGAGPAGAATSFFLSKNRVPHVVLEKEIFPRDKVCGDACSGKTAVVIKRADPSWLDEILNDTHQFLPSWGITFVAPNGKSLDIPFSPDRKPESRAPGFTVSRLVFDDFLVHKMDSPYCTLLQGAKVEHIDTAGDGVTVKAAHNGTQLEISAPVIIGADGDKSLVRKHFLDEQASMKAYAVGLRAYYEGITGLHSENFIELHFLPEMLPGYLWIFPLPGGRANVGVGILSKRIRDKKINLREQMLSAIQNNPQIAPRFASAKLIDKIQGWGLPLAMDRQPLSGNKFLLTGDAARLIDPFSGEGIGNAMYSGMLAASAVVQGLGKNDFSATHLREAYDAVFYKRMGGELQISATLHRLCNYPSLFNFVANKANKSDSLRNTISCMFSNMDLRAQLRKPSFYLKILLNK